MASSSPARWHWALGFVACVGIPAASWIEGSRLFAWTMFSGAEPYRIDIVATEADGTTETVNPTALAAHAAPHVAVYLAGADHWRNGTALVSLLRAHLDDLAVYACHETKAASIAVTLRERQRFGGDRQTSRAATCRP